MCGLLPACNGAEVGGETDVSASAPASAPQGSVALSDVPLELQRRALRHVSAIQSGGIQWSDATLAPYAVPLYRPDVAGVAYYELSVLGADGAPSGYLIVATGEHDT